MTKTAVTSGLLLGAILFGPEPAVSQSIGPRGRVPQHEEPPSAASTQLMAGVPTLLDSRDDIVGQMRVLDSGGSAIVFVAVGEIDSRSVPATVSARASGFYGAGSTLLFRDPDCTGSPHLRENSPPPFSDRFVASAAVVGVRVPGSSYVSGPETTAWVPFGDVRKRSFQSKATAIGPEVPACPDGFVIAPTLCCTRISETVYSIPAVGIDLGRFETPLRVEILEAKFVDDAP